MSELNWKLQQKNKKKNISNCAPHQTSYPGSGIVIKIHSPLRKVLSCVNYTKDIMLHIYSMFLYVLFFYSTNDSEFIHWKTTNISIKINGSLVACYIGASKNRLKIFKLLKSILKNYCNIII